MREFIFITFIVFLIVTLGIIIGLPWWVTGALAGGTAGVLVSKEVLKRKEAQ